MYIVGSYYGNLVKGNQGFAKGGDLSPTIFNIVVGTVICHWVTMVGGGTVPDGFGRVVQQLPGFFYANNGLLDSPRTARLQAALDFLTRLFDMVGIYTNIKNGWDSMPALLHCRWTLGGGIYSADDGRGYVLLGAVEGES